LLTQSALFSGRNSKNLECVLIQVSPRNRKRKQRVRQNTPLEVMDKGLLPPTEKQILFLQRLSNLDPKYFLGYDREQISVLIEEFLNAPTKSTLRLLQEITTRTI